MARLSKQDKKDLLEQARGKFFKPAKPKRLNIDEFIEFLTLTNAFANHKRRPFRPITGDKFRL